MNAKEFYEKFIAAMREENIATNEQIKKHLDQVGWTYKKIYRECESAFTELANKGIVDRIIESEDGLIPQHEYLRIDSIGYKHRYTEISEEEAREVGLNRHFWELAIAVEHENSKHDWMDEVIKLLHVRCPLKVVISYNYCDCREEMEINKLGFIAKYMKKWLENYPNDKDEENARNKARMRELFNECVPEGDQYTLIYCHMEDFTDAVVVKVTTHSNFIVGYKPGEVVVVPVDAELKGHEEPVVFNKENGGQIKSTLVGYCTASKPDVTFQFEPITYEPGIKRGSKYAVSVTQSHAEVSAFRKFFKQGL